MIRLPEYIFCEVETRQFVEHRYRRNVKTRILLMMTTKMKIILVLARAKKFENFVGVSTAMLKILLVLDTKMKILLVFCKKKKR